MSELDAYDYKLPEHLIAQHPEKDRTNARLMVVDRKQGTISHRHIRDLPEYLNANDVLVLNDTKVVPARLIGYRTTTGGHWEGLFLRFDANGVWEVMSKARGKLLVGETITLLTPQGEHAFQLKIEGRTPARTLLVKPVCTDDSAAKSVWSEDPFSLLDAVGRVPIPPYIRSGKMEEDDRNNYQTVYAEHPGAVAAPTAGLHFTRELLDRIKSRGVEICPVTLHVGAGTFKPITADRLSDHHMHSEFAVINREAVETIEQGKRAGGRTVAIGTTSVRVLESASNVRPDGTIDSSGENNAVLVPFRGETNLFIRPPYQFKTVDVMLTNFHLPKSTLIILVCAFGGEELIQRAYREAVEQEYRFYSYGDAMLIF
ncbi:MAG: tRNA preQ1(34) S-adenosylmethionine ribosyltransferase-isomerase QueA [Planctomycetia bacterium]|nr:tRNA preQ1(34) S-adenosylmethionine ribosyltransferase-isomerase QueA [Planctomycetia bacterium]